MNDAVDAISPEALTVGCTTRTPSKNHLGDRVRSALSNPDLWLLWCGLQIPSLRVYERYVPHPLKWAVVLYLLVAVIAYAAIMERGRRIGAIRRLLSSWTTLVLLITLVVVANYVAYPIADGLKYQLRGSDQDNCVITVGSRFLHLLSPYAENTYLGNPCSPGPGWVLLLLPFSNDVLYFLMTPLALGVAMYVVYRISGSVYRTNLFLVLCLSSAAFWETMFAGSDLFSVGCVICACLFLLHRSLQKEHSRWAGGLLLALVSTARVVFLYLAPMIGVFVWKQRKRYGYWALATGTVGALLIHGSFFLWDPNHYTPLHVIRKGLFLLSGPLRLVLVGAALVIAWVTVRRVTNALSSWLHYTWLGMIVPLTLVALGDLIGMCNGRCAHWEGANYLMTPLALLVSRIALNAR